MPSTEPSRPRKITLKRSLSLPLLTLYGLGTIVGGGFYALIGKVSGHAGMFAPLAFLTSATVAMFSAFSYAELSARYSRSAGESLYVMVAFRKQALSTVVGWLVILTGVVSAATLATAIAGFLRDLAQIPETTGIILVVIGLGLIAAWGIMESVTLAIAITVIEVGGLIFVVFVGGGQLQEIPQRWGELVPPVSFAAWKGILLGGFLAFYSFIGFEDMVNVAEEVKNPTRNLPIAILLALLLTTVLYLAVSLTAVMAVTPQELARSHTPLALVVAPAGPVAQKAMGVISILAGVNGALVQIIMAARVAFGMSDTGLGPAWFAVVNEKTRTPLRATGFMTAIILILALWFPLVTLAKATSSIILVIFALVNLALVVIKKREPQGPPGAPNYPFVLPVIGFFASSGFLLFHLFSQPG